MAPKKGKKEEEERQLAPEEFLPADFSLGCEVYWVHAALPVAENGDAVTCGQKGTLEKVHELTQPGNRIEFVNVLFEGNQESSKVEFAGLATSPPGFEELGELSTGLVLPIRGVEVQRLWALESHDALAEALDQMLKLEAEFEDPTQREIARDFHIFSLEHSRSIALTTAQAATFHGIMVRVLTSLRKAESVPGNSDGMSKSFEEFKGLILQHATNAPPERLAIFSAAEARMLVDFATGTVFKHFLLYQCCLHSAQQVELVRSVDTLDRPLAPPDLNAPSTRQLRRDQGSSKGVEIDPAGVPDASLAGDAEDPERQGTPTEEEEVERAVRERLRETAAALQKRLEEREAQFREKLQALPPQPKAKSKK